MAFLTSNCSEGDQYVEGDQVEKITKDRQQVWREGGGGGGKEDCILKV